MQSSQQVIMARRVTIRKRSWMYLALAWFALPAFPAAAQNFPGQQQAPSVAAPPQPSPLAPVQPWEYSPYRIRVWLAATSSAYTNPQVLADLQREIETWAESIIGAPWSLTISAPPAALESTVAYSSDIVTDVDIGAAQKEALKDDKIVLVSLHTDPIGIQVRVRELDCHARIWGPTVTRDVRQPSTLCRAVFDAILAAFAPLARIEAGQGKTCIARARAGGLVLSSDSPASIGKGDVLRPIFRQNDRYGEPIKNRVQILPFTYLHVTSLDSVSPSLLSCNVVSGMRGPIHGRSTSRRERWALRVRPAFDATEVVVESKPNTRTEPKVRLAGMEVYAKTPVPEPAKVESKEERLAAEKKNPPELLGVTDWRGSLTIPNSGSTLRVMYVKNGGILLARLPIVAGVDQRVVAEVPDDNARLQAEGFVKGLNGEITDLVVQRQLIGVRLRKKISEGKLEEAQKLLDEFRSLKTLNDLQRMLDQQLTRQKPTTNAGVKQKIDKLYADEREMIAKYVGAEMLNQLTQELASARRNPPKPPSSEQTANESATPSEGKKEKKELPGALKTKAAVATPNPGAPSSPQE